MMIPQAQQSLTRVPSAPRTMTAFSQVPQELTEDSYEGHPSHLAEGHILASGRDLFKPAPSRSRLVAELPSSNTVLNPFDTMPRSLLPPKSQPAKSSYVGGAAEALLSPPLQKQKPELCRLRWKFFPAVWKGPAWTRVFSQVHFFTLLSLAALAVPLSISRQLEQDATAHYFGGPWAELAYLAPCFAMVAHVAHVHSGKLSLLPAVLGTVPGPLVLAVVGNAYRRGSPGDLADELSSKDCAWSDAKLKIHMSWREANSLSKKCLDTHLTNFEDGERLFRIQECRKYLQDHSKVLSPSFREGVMHALFGPWHTKSFGAVESQYMVKRDAYAEHRVAWRYLESLEEDQQCSGWCSSSPAIWTAQKTKDKCSSVAGLIMKSKVQPLAYSLLVYSVSMIIVAIAFIGWLKTSGVISKK